MEISYIIKTCIIILSIFTILSLIVFVFLFISNSLAKNKSRLKIKHISHNNKDHSRKTINKKHSGIIVNFERRFNNEKPLDTISLASHSMEEI